MNILIIGFGNMGSAIGNALSQNHSVYAIDPAHTNTSASTPQNEAHTIPIFQNIETASTNINEEIDIIILTVKPQIINAVLQELVAYVSDTVCIISSVAGLTMEHITQALQKDASPSNAINSSSNIINRIVRIMPNIAAKEKESITGVCIPEGMNDEYKKMALSIVESFGKYIIVSEEQIHAITGIAGSGIAFVTAFIESLTMAGVREGLHYDTAYKTTLQTVRGALSLLEPKKERGTQAAFDSPSSMINAICSPGGTTIEGMHSLHKNKMHYAVLEAVHSASNKSKSF